MPAVGSLEGPRPQVTPGRDQSLEPFRDLSKHLFRSGLTLGPIPNYSSPMRTNKRSRQRLAVVAVAAGLLVGMARLPLWAAATHPAAQVVHIVAPGETLWGLAERYAPREDPREYIYNLDRINNLGDGQIFPGEKLTLP